MKNKELFLIFIPLTALIGALAIAFYYMDIGSEKSVHLSDERKNIQHANEITISFYDHAISDLKFLSTRHDVIEAYQAGALEPSSNLEDTFAHFMTLHSTYDQIMLIDDMGMELLRINNPNGTPVIVPAKDLQSKASGYYFKETIKMDIGEIFITSMDLNKEHGIVEKPFKPTIRLATPVIARGARKAVIVLNVLGSRLIEDLTHGYVSPVGNLYLLNHEGYWLSGPSKDLEWGFMIPERAGISFSNSHPTAWERIETENNGQFETDVGVYTFNTVLPLEDTTLQGGVKNYLKIVSLVEADMLSAGPRKLVIRLFILYASFVSLLALGLWYLDRKLARSLWTPMQSAKPMSLMVIVALTVFFSEFLVMVLLQFMPELPTLTTALADSFLLTLLLIPTFMFLIVRPFTLHLIEREKVEAKLAMSEERYGTIVNTTMEGYWRIDSDHRIVEVNGALCKMLGFAPDGLIGKATGDLVAKPQLDQFISERDLGHPTLHKTYEITLKSSDDDNVHTIVNSTTLRNDNNQVIGAYAFITDITKLITAQEKLEEAIGIKDKFVSLVAHDLRSPLATIISSLEFLQKHREKLTNDQAAELMELSINNCQRAVTLIDELLDIGKMRTGLVKLNKRFFDAHDTVARLIVANRFSADEKHIRLENKVPKHSRIFADYEMFFQVMQNLVSNAIKFSNADGEVSISFENADEVYIGIRDTGVGIEPDKIPKLTLFEENTSTPGTNGERGTGLGLPMIKEILDMHDGGLDVESTPGEGSLFTARLPKIYPKVLIVDSAADDTDALAMALKDQDYDVLHTPDCAMGLTIIREEQINLMICDLKLNGMDSVELIRSVKNDPDLKTIPVIATTYELDIQKSKKAFRAGASHVIGKPLDMKRFVMYVDSIVV